jgi:D-psicose/D-tagatose/L-ribulose 3-epimerase
VKTRLPLGIQLALPAGFEQDKGFSDILSLLRSEGFLELELNIPDPEQVEPDRLIGLLGRFGSSLTRLATGQAARLHGLSLCAADDAVRQWSVQRCEEMILYAARYPAEVIIGILKGNPGTDPGAAEARLEVSLAELERRLGKSPVPVLLEVTCRAKCPVISTPQEALDAIARHPGFGFRVLLDTYHLCRQGIDIVPALAGFPGLHGSIHLSDDNRRLPGLGGIDFAPIIGALTTRGYEGSLVLEGAFSGDPGEDIVRSARYMHGLLGY